jgi:outer membrane protein TolC
MQKIGNKIMLSIKKIIISIILLTLICQPVLAGEAVGFNKEAFIASAGVKKALQIGMVDCVAMALKNNSEIQVRRIEPLKAGDDVLVQKAAFDPELSFNYSMENDVEQSAAGLIAKNPSKDRTNVFNFGYDEKFVTGTQVGLDFYNTRASSNSPIQNINPAFDSELGITITQPLMKGAGIIVNKAFFLIAQNNQLKSVQDFTYEVINILTEVKKNYYEFQYTQEQYRVARTSLERVQNLHYINKEKYAKGLASNVDLLQSESEVARMEQATYAAERVMKASEDRLKYITNLVNDPDLWNADITLLDKVGYEKKEVDLKTSVITAFEHRPDYEAAKIDLKSKDISIVYYKNALLPQVDLIGSYSLNGLDKNYGKDLRHLGSGKYQDWLIGVNVSMPIFFDKERGEYDKSKLEKNQALIKFKRLEQQIILAVRDAVRDIDLRYKSVEASTVSKNAEEENYTAQESRFKAGLVSTLDMLIYQERLARAQVDYIKTIIDYNVSLIELARVQGMTLINDNIAIE